MRKFWATGHGREERATPGRRRALGKNTSVGHWWAQSAGECRLDAAISLSLDSPCRLLPLHQAAPKRSQAHGRQPQENTQSRAKGTRGESRRLSAGGQGGRRGEPGTPHSDGGLGPAGLQHAR